MFKNLNRASSSGLKPATPPPSYCAAFKKPRFLVPADGFYERRTIAGSKIPFAMADMALAQLPSTCLA